MKAKNILASNQKCCKCGKQAVCFFPVFDPDIQSYPYCRKCMDDTKMKLIMQFSKIDKKFNKKPLKNKMKNK